MSWGFDVLIDPRVVILKAVDLLGGNHAVLTEPNIVRNAIGESLNVLHMVLQEPIPVCRLEAFLQGLLSLSRPHLLQSWWWSAACGR